MKKTLAIAALLLFALQAHALSFIHIATLLGNESGVAQDRFSDPKGLFVDSGGRLYVADAGSSRIVVYDANFSYLTFKGGTHGTGNEEFDSPEGMCVDSEGKLYIADTFNHRIQIWTGYSGAYLKTIPTGTGDSYTLHRPSSLAVDSNGTMHVADTYNNRIMLYAKTGLFIRTIYSTDPFGDYVFRKPTGIFLDEAQRRILVADSENDRVQIFDLNYTFVGRIGWGQGNEQLSLPRAAVTDAAGKIYIADTGNDRVQVFSSNLTFAASLPGNATDSNASFGSPQGIAVDSRGRLFVSDGLNKRVLVFLVVDTELEAQYARNKVEAARAAVNDAALQVSAAQSKVDAIVASGCTDGGNARAYLHVASDRLAIANNSLASADFMLARSNYSEAQAHADSAVSFANESAQSANDSARYADEFNAAAGSAVTGMNAALGLFSEADGLNATAARLNITLRNLSALDTAHFSYNIAEARCGEANYASAEKDAEDAQGNATAAIGNMRQQINLAIIPAYAQLRDEFALVKGNVTLYDLPIDTTPVEIDLSLANTLILDSKYEDALSRMASVRANLTIIQERVDSYTSEVEARRLYLGAALNSTRGRLSGLAALAQNYSQHPDFARANGLVRSAEANLSLGDLSATNASLGQANLELDGLNESLQGRIALIGNAAAAIGQAKADVARAEAAGIPFFGANTASAHSDISAAEAVLYSDPESASRLALNASSTARAEEARLNSQRPMVLGVAVGVLLLLVAAFLVFTGAMAGVYTLIRHLRKKAREEEAKLEAALLGRSGKAGEKQEAAPRKGRKRRPEMEAS